MCNMSAVLRAIPEMLVKAAITVDCGRRRGQQPPSLRTDTAAAQDSAGEPGCALSGCCSFANR